MEELTKNVESVIAQMFSNWDCSEISEIIDNISDEVAADVMETSDYPYYNDSDISIAVKRVVLSKLNGND